MGAAAPALLAEAVEAPVDSPARVVERMKVGSREKMRSWIFMGVNKKWMLSFRMRGAALAWRP